MTLESEILVDLLAAADAVWLPIRDWGGAAGPNVGAARAAFRRVGVHRTAHASTDADRKADQRALRALARRKLLRVFRPGGVKTTAAALTDAGDAAARALAGLPSLADSRRVLDAIAALSTRPPRTLGDVWIGERRLAGIAPDAADESARLALGVLELDALPALTRGLAESASDARGRASYAVAAAGWRWIGTPAPRREPTRTKPDPDGQAFYVERRGLALAQLAGGRRVGREVGLLPLPASTGGVPLLVCYAPAGIVAAALPMESQPTMEKPNYVE